MKITQVYRDAYNSTVFTILLTRRNRCPDSYILLSMQCSHFMHMKTKIKLTFMIPCCYGDSQVCRISSKLAKSWCTQNIFLCSSLCDFIRNITSTEDILHPDNLLTLAETEKKRKNQSSNMENVRFVFYYVGQMLTKANVPLC